jgi:AbiJ N-terminal domain 4
VSPYWYSSQSAEPANTEAVMLDDSPEPFSRRHGFRPPDPPITIWDDAPEDFRHVVLSIAHDKCGMKPSPLRELVCGVLRKRPDPSNWSEYPNVWDEVEGLVYRCEWYKVYDIVEAIRADLSRANPGYLNRPSAEVVTFEHEINTVCRELGIGWQIKDGLIQARGDDGFEAVVAGATEALAAAGMATAHNELQEALKDISRRPHADATGAVQHSMAALECVAKDVTGEPKATLGDILSRHATVVPRPLDQAVHKVWGFASDRARHVREGQALDRPEAQLVVGLAAALANYLLQKARPASDGGAS